MLQSSSEEEYKSSPRTCPVLSSVVPEVDDFPGILSTASQSELQSLTALFFPTTDGIIAPSSFSLSLLCAEDVCLKEVLMRFGRLDCNTLAMLCVWEEPCWNDGPLNAAVATASFVWSKDRGWSWSPETASEAVDTGLVGPGPWNLVFDWLQGSCLSGVFRHPVHRLGESLSYPLHWLLPSRDSQGRGFLAVNESESTKMDERLSYWPKSSQIHVTGD